MIGQTPVNPYLNQSANYLNQAAANAMPSPESRDRAAGRLREQISRDTNSMETQLRNQFGNRGNLQSGLFNQAYLGNQAAGLQARSQGLAQIEDDYERQRMQGAQNLGQIGGTLGNLGYQQQQSGLEQMRLALEESLGLGSQAIQKRGQDIEQQLGLGSQAIQTRGQDIDKALQETSLALQRELGLGDLQVKQLEQVLKEKLGLGGLGLEEQKIAQEGSIAKNDALIEFLKTMGTFGNTRGGEDERGQLFDSQFMDIINRLLGGL